MATYVPNATQATQPVASQTVFSAAEEFRVLKTSVNAMRQWLGVHASAPPVDILGDPIAQGDFYYNSSSLKMFVYSSGAWQDVDKTATVGSGTGNVTIALNITADIFVLTPASNVTIVAGVGMATGQSVLFLVTNPGAFTVTWPSGIKWLNGVTPTLLAAGTTFVEIMKIGSTVYGVALGGAV